MRSVEPQSLLGMILKTSAIENSSSSKELQLGLQRQREAFDEAIQFLKHVKRDERNW